MTNMLRLVLIAIYLLIQQAIFPISAVLYNGTGASAENKLIAMTIAGIVNREAPRLYMLNVYETWSYNQTDEMWRDIYAADGGVNFTNINNINDLVQHFSSDLRGAITYDPALTYGNFTGQNFRWQAEVAAMISGLSNCIPLPFNSTAININKPDSVWVSDHFHGQDSIRISARLELADHSWNNEALQQEQRYFSILDWALETLLPFTNPKKFYLREITDWAIGQRMFQMNLAGTETLNFYSLSDEKAEKIEQVLTYLQEHSNNEIFHVYGWMRPEPLVQWISAWGGSFHETLLGNLSWHHIFPVDEIASYVRPSAAMPGSQQLEDKHYVLFIGSEGDAGNWNFGFQAGAWHSSMRGNVPVGWGFNLHFFETFPFVGQYYYRTATANDGFVSVTTPLGYAYPDMFPQDYLPDAIEKTQGMLQKYDIPAIYAYKHYNGAGISTYRSITISNNFNFNKLGSFAEETETGLTFLFDPALQTQQAYTNFGGLLYNHVNDETFYADVRDLYAVSGRIVNKLRNKPLPNFLLAGYQRFRHDSFSAFGSNPADLTVPRLNTIMQQVMNDPEVGSQVEFVTPERFTDLLRQHLGLTQHVFAPLPPRGKAWVSYDGQSNAFLNLHLAQPEQVVIRIFDISGKQHDEFVWKMSLAADSGRLPMNALSRGVYLISVSSGNYFMTVKVVK
jgi:hypothetical protein